MNNEPQRKKKIEIFVAAQQEYVVQVKFRVIVLVDKPDMQ